MTAAIELDLVGTVCKWGFEWNPRAGEVLFCNLSICGDNRYRERQMLIQIRYNVNFMKIDFMSQKSKTSQQNIEVYYFDYAYLIRDVWRHKASDMAAPNAGSWNLFKIS